MAAFAAAYLLVLQSVLGAFAFGASANPAPLDAFGNVICTHDGAADLPGGGPPQKHVPNCCLFGCGTISQALAGPPDASAVPGAIAFETIAFITAPSEHLAFRRDRSPANPRAPPAA